MTTEAANVNGVAATEVRRTISPYDLTSADNPGVVISHPLLKGANYDEWTCGMKTALSSQKKFGFLDGSISRSAEGSSDLEDWWMIQALLVSWIKMSIDPSIRTNISHRDVPKDLWDQLKKRFSVTSGPRIQQLKAELACCKQRTLAIEVYYGKLSRIWDSMANCRPLRVCKCGKCECDLGTLQEHDREENKVHKFLFGLDENYQTVRSSLVSRVPLQSLEEVYNIVRQEEDLGRGATKIPEENQEISAFVAQVKPQLPREEKDKTLFCKHCNRSGHATESCYGVIGYPEWWGDRPRTRTTAGRGCGGLINNRRGRGGVTFANDVQVNPLASCEHANYVVTDKDRDGVNGLSDTQWRTLVSLLNGGASSSNGGAGTINEKLSGNSSYSTWILDTGASHHLTGKYHLLTDVRPIEQPVLVILADGRERIATKEGTVVLGPNLVLQSVFYVEEFQSDLISMGQLMDENRCIVQLADKFLVVQDRVSRMMIGAGRREAGTFRLCITELAASVTVSRGEILRTMA